LLINRGRYCGARVANKWGDAYPPCFLLGMLLGINGLQKNNLQIFFGTFGARGAV